MFFYKFIEQLLYDENEESVRQIDTIVDDLYNEGYYEDDVDKFKIEQVPFFE